MASKLHGTDVEVSVVQNKSDNGADHVQFLITERKDCQKSEEMMGISADAFTMANFPFLSKGEPSILENKNTEKHIALSKFNSFGTESQKLSFSLLFPQEKKT